MGVKWETRHSHGRAIYSGILYAGTVGSQIGEIHYPWNNPGNIELLAYTGVGDIYGNHYGYISYSDPDHDFHTTIWIETPPCFSLG